MADLTDISTIRDLCQRYNFALSKGFGQNFIVNPGVCPKLIHASEIGADWGVLEIGPGIGVLTRELARAAQKVVAVEVDQRLLPLLDETLAGMDNVKIILGDVLKVDLQTILRQEFPGMKVAVCANLPYYITTPILMRLLEECLPIESITVLVQREAGQRITAAPGTREAGAISYGVSYYAQPQLLFNVQPGSFFPAPKVTSSVIRLKMRQQLPLPAKEEERLFKVIRAAFGQRRKNAVNSIAHGLGMDKAQVSAAMTAAGLDLRARPEQLTLEQFDALQKALWPEA